MKLNNCQYKLCTNFKKHDWQLDAIVPIFNINCKSKQRLWWLPQLTFISFNFIEKWTFEAIRGERGEKDERCITIHFLCSWCKTLNDTSTFTFGIKISFAILKEEFGKDIFNIGIILNLQRLILKIFLICVFLLQVEVRTYDWLQGHSAEMQLNQICKNRWQYYSVTEI